MASLASTAVLKLSTERVQSSADALASRLDGCADDKERARALGFAVGKVPTVSQLVVMTALARMSDAIAERKEFNLLPDMVEAICPPGAPVRVAIERSAGKVIEDFYARGSAKLAAAYFAKPGAVEAVGADLHELSLRRFEDGSFLAVASPPSKSVLAARRGIFSDAKALEEMVSPAQAASIKAGMRTVVTSVLGRRDLIRGPEEMRQAMAAAPGLIEQAALNLGRHLVRGGEGGASMPMDGMSDVESALRDYAEEDGRWQAGTRVTVDGAPCSTVGEAVAQVARARAGLGAAASASPEPAPGPELSLGGALERLRSAQADGWVVLAFVSPGHDPLWKAQGRASEELAASMKSLPPVAKGVPLLFAIDAKGGERLIPLAAFESLLRGSGYYVSMSDLARAEDGLGPARWKPDPSRIDDFAALLVERARKAAMGDAGPDAPGRRAPLTAGRR